MTDHSPPRRGSWMAMIDAFLAAHERKDYSAVRDLIEQHGLHIFHHVPIHQFAKVLGDAVAEDPKRRDVAFAFHLFVRGASGRRFFDTPVLDGLASQNRGLQLAYMFDLRLQGRAKEALAYSRLSLDDLAVIQPFIDAHDGWPQFIAVQRGITAMLAGELADALRHFENAQLRASTPGLEFLLRDALVKHALIHATFGDPDAGAALLDRARAVPRTDSWTEASIDTAFALTEVLLEPVPSDARRRLQRLDLSNIGELWPFYVHAEYRVLDNSGAFAFAVQRLEQLEALPFPRIDGQGYTGSVIPLAMALNCIATGTPAIAKQHLERVDADFVLAGIIRSLLELQVGAYPKAITTAAELHTATRNLRRLELWRLSILADAHFHNGDQNVAVAVLQQIDDLPGTMTEQEAEFFTLDLRALGRQHVDAWPGGRASERAYMDQLVRLEGHFTARELEILRLLPQDMNRRELAETLFISQNTLKTQLRTLFRKLSVSSREEALAEAAKRGLL